MAQANRPILYGANYSVYVRICRLALIEKGVDHDVVDVDIFSTDGPPDWYGDLQPFGKIPAFRHGDFSLYETGAITRYIDEAFEGPRLQPSSPEARARLNQIIGIIDAYAYRTLVWDIYVERVSKPREGKHPDETRIAAALPRARLCLRAIDEFVSASPFLLGRHITLADLHLAPVFGYFAAAPEGSSMIEAFPALQEWWDMIANRPSVLSTRID
ncbi:glutathione S-transferase family protein [Aliihoeflea sp. PC F10.4]